MRKRQHVALRVAGEDQAGIGGEHARARAAGAQFVAPADLAGLVVDRLQHALAPHAVVGARPAERRRRRAWRNRCHSWGARSR